MTVKRSVDKASGTVSKPEHAQSVVAVTDWNVALERGPGLTSKLELFS